ncbi:MAG: triose-phosphate isomerase [Gemmatimonadaceae bacterium]
MNHPIFAANWKMNHGPSEARSFIKRFLTQYTRHYDRTVIFFPPSASIEAVDQLVESRADILVGAQNIHWESQGAFTGEMSGQIARDAGATLVLVGHSERRHVFGETDEDTARKCAAAERAGLRPMLCVGEKLDEREAGKTKKVVLRQLRAGFSKLAQIDAFNPIVAYEPVWAIGTGRNATPDDASSIHGVIRAELKEIVGDRARAIPVLYGGSVNAGNAPALLSAPDVDGVLVGGASLDTGSWMSIVRTRLTAEIPPGELASDE